VTGEREKGGRSHLAVFRFSAGASDVAFMLRFVASRGDAGPCLFGHSGVGCFVRSAATCRDVSRHVDRDGTRLESVGPIGEGCAGGRRGWMSGGRMIEG
jgi:hypothetical protein